MPKQNGLSAHPTLNAIPDMTIPAHVELALLRQTRSLRVNDYHLARINAHIAHEVKNEQQEAHFSNIMREAVQAVEIIDAQIHEIERRAPTPSLQVS